MEIIRCLIRNPKVLIMDEPTSVWKQETSELFLSLEGIFRRRILIIYMQKLKEVNKGYFLIMEYQK